MKKSSIEHKRLIDLAVCKLIQDERFADYEVIQITREAYIQVGAFIDVGLDFRLEQNHNVSWKSDRGKHEIGITKHLRADVKAIMIRDYDEDITYGRKPIVIIEAETNPCQGLLNDYFRLTAYKVIKLNQKDDFMLILAIYKDEPLYITERMYNNKNVNDFFDEVWAFDK